MPLFMDVHSLEGVTPEAVAQAHQADVDVQTKYGVSYRKYWLNQDAGKVFCLVEAPSAEAADAVHREAHGLAADKIIPVDPLLAEQFLGGHQDLAGAVLMPSPGDERRLDPGVRTILFSDMVESTAMTQQLGDNEAMAILRAHNRIARDAVEAHGGRQVKHTGDGIMASFWSAAGAVRSAMDIQRGFAAYNRDHGVPIRVRIGATSGEPVQEQDDLFGAAVQLAARICAYAGAEKIVVSNVVAELCLGKGLSFVDLGYVSLKGFDQPIRMHEVQWMVE